MKQLDLWRAKFKHVQETPCVFFCLAIRAERSANCSISNSLSMSDTQKARRGATPKIGRACFLPTMAGNISPPVHTFVSLAHIIALPEGAPAHYANITRGVAFITCWLVTMVPLALAPYTALAIANGSTRKPFNRKRCGHLRSGSGRDRMVLTNNTKPKRKSRTQNAKRTMQKGNGKSTHVFKMGRETSSM